MQKKNKKVNLTPCIICFKAYLCVSEPPVVGAFAYRKVNRRFLTCTPILVPTTPTEWDRHWSVFASVSQKTLEEKKKPSHYFNRGWNPRVTFTDLPGHRRCHSWAAYGPKQENTTQVIAPCKCEEGRKCSIFRVQRKDIPDRFTCT